MHPKHKLTYFDKEGWLKSWKEEAQQVIRDHWSQWYKPTGLDQATTTTVVSSLFAFRPILTFPLQFDPDDMFASLDAPLSGTTASDPLEDWMTSGVIDCKDPVVWWSNQLDSKASTVHPALARMAIDLLSTPGMFLILGSFFVTNYFLGALAEMERGFSWGGLMVSPRRHNLKGASVRAGTVLSSWREIPGLLPEKELVKLFNDKSARKKTGSEATINVD